MDSPTSPPQGIWLKRIGIGLGVAAAIAVAVVFAMNSIPGEPDAATRPPAPVRPPVPDRTSVQDQDPVIGVTLGQRHRAYLLADLYRPDNAVKNDLFDDVPVSVTFCSLDKCVRAFTHQSRGEPLVLGVGGADPNRSRKMLLQIKDRKFEQDTGRPMDGDTTRPFPYTPVPSTLTTWGEWKTAHPHTELRAHGVLYPPEAK